MDPCQSVRYELGNANVDQETVDRAVEAIKDLSNKPYLDGLRNKRIKNPVKGVESFYIHIPCDSSSQNSSAEPRYQSHLYCNLRDVDETTPLGLLVLKISKRISDLGIRHDKAWVMFEKGCSLPVSSEWHCDGTANGVSAISICYSNKRNWNTRIVDTKHAFEILKTTDVWSLTMAYLDSLKVNDAVHKQIESLSEPAKAGILYDARLVLHRSPAQADLGESAPSLDDYRLFIRFN